ncbi:EAL domain-containing protein [Pseudoduganella sp. FT93W]|uniref:Virulence sensor protein BvgS n=2 Tax=Duganella fentianensis TaxID=2692177 RepID=A0A845HXF7_9BURK|nr:EAL domain-containing protein [Duganella fentianensis]
MIQSLRLFLRRTGFQRQLMLIAASSILGLAVFSALMNAREANVRMRDYYIGQGQRIAENLARQSTLALLFHSPENAREVVSTTLAFPDVSAVQIMDAQQRVLVSETPAGQPALHAPGIALPARPSLISEDSRSWLFAAPVFGGQAESSPLDPQDVRPQVQGYVQVQIAKSTLNSLTNSLLLGNLVLTLSFAVLVLGVGRLLTRHMIRPLNALSELMRRAEAGESGMRARPSGPRDLIDMAQAFNQMMVVLEQRERELKESRDAAINLAQLKAQFAATVSHEVRTPLNGVVGMLDMLRETRLSARQQELVDVAWNSSNTLIELINNILDFSKLEAGKLTLEPNTFDLPALLDQVIELLEPQASQKGLRLSWQAAGELPRHVTGDAMRLRQILLNLIGNAIKFTARGEISVSLHVSGDAGAMRLHCSVRDTGIGMSADVCQRLFHAYVQPETGTTRRYGGTGLGLAICKQLVELLGGQISVESNPGQGSCFSFDMQCQSASTAPAPRALPTAADDGSAALPAALARSQPAQAVSAPPRFRVLVAEDNRTNQMVAAGMLALNDCACVFAADGAEAVRAAQREQFDLILMDCSMPEMDGYEATAHIRLAELASGRRTPLLAMTANTQSGDAEKCLAAGMDDYLAKPITLVELRRKLEKWLPLLDVLPPPQPVAMNSAGPCPVNRAVFEPLCQVLGASLPQAIEPYLEDAPRCIDDVQQALATGNFTLARERAHTLKGASANLGAEALAQLAQQVEEYAARGQGELLAPLLVPLRSQYAALAGFLQAQLRVISPALEQHDDSLAQVLIVDDDRSTRSTLRHTLQRDGFQVEEAADGAQALAMLAVWQPDVILMDAMMPVMDGFTACARMQQLPHGSEIPVLMITALQDNASVEKAFAAGASDYIPKPIHYAVLSQRVRRIIEGNRAEKRIRHLAYNDVLTNLPNRTLFFDLLAQRISRAGEQQQQLGVLFMDLDRFKYVNDNLGHHIGDRLLQAVAQRVRQTVRDDDTVARLGGDEFTVVLDHLDSPAAAATAAQNIVRALSAPFPIDGNDIFVTASVGIAMYPHDGLDVASLVKHADSAMYRAKRTNSGFQFYEASMELSISEHVRLESDLRHAMLQGHQLEVYYQPQARMQDGSILGMEALLRWHHPLRGLIPPDQFVPLAEETGLIIPIGEWVLRSACTQLQSWRAEGMPDLRVAVNLSVRQLLQKNFSATVASILAESGLPPAMLELEITESTLMENAQDTLATLHSLHGLGVRLSIDDFGTGYSSLSYLKRFPVDILKIDRSFVQDVPQDSDDMAIVSAIIALAHSLRLEVVAEGVETEAQLAFLRARQCDLLQGYYLSPALPARQCAELIRAHLARGSNSLAAQE